MNKLFITFFLLALATVSQCQSINSYKVDIKQCSTSGLSAGGFMSVQFHIAFSSYMKGIGCVAGGPYLCAYGELGTAVSACMTWPDGINLNLLENAILELNANGEIDNLQNLERQRVYLYSGTKDTVVFPGVMSKLEQQYERFGSKIMTDFTTPSQHAWITDNFGNACDKKGSPYMSNCDLNQAWDMLDYIFDNLEEGVAMVEENLMTFSQEPYNQDNDSLGDLGYYYVPTSCQNGSKCKIHISFHGCQQTLADVGTDYVVHTGLNEIAEANNIIVLYPQAASSSYQPINPNGCFDWWGYTDDNAYGKNSTYVTKRGSQMASVWNMVNDIAGENLSISQDKFEQYLELD